MTQEPSQGRSIREWDPIRLAPYYSMFFLWSLGTGAQQLARPLFAAELGATPFLVVLITASNAIARLIISPTTGFLADHLGRKPLVLLGNGIRFVTLVGQFFAQTYLQFFVLEFVGAIGVAMWGTSSQVAMADFTTAANRGRLMALRSMTNQIGVIAGPATGALIIVAFHDNLRYVFLFNAVTKILIDVLVRFFGKETAPEANRRTTPKAQREKLDLSFFMTRGFIALALTTFALNMMGQGGAFGALFPVQARNDVGLTSAEIGKMLSIAGFIGLLVAYPNGWAIDHFGRKPTLIPGLCFLAAAAIVLANLSGVNQIYIMLVFYGLGSAMSMGASQAFAVDLAPPDRRGSFLGLWALIAGFGSIVAPLAIGAVATNLGYAPGYTIVAVLLLLSAGFMLFFGPETKAQRERQAARAASAPGG